MYRTLFGNIPMLLLAAEAAASTAPAAPAEEKQTIAQKVEALQADKTNKIAEMNAAPEGPAKVALQEAIAVIDRKLRWYAGRSGEGKAKSAKAKSPSKGRAKKSDAPASAPAQAPAPVASANES